jgi:hypothetical protein
MHEAVLEDVEVQRKGIIYIAGSPRRVATLQEQDRKFDNLVFSHIRKALPVRVAGVHHYVSSRLLEYIVPITLFIVGPAIRARYRMHMGREENVLAELAEYGIIRDILPTDMGGTHDFDYTAWLHQRRAE